MTKLLQIAIDENNNVVSVFEVATGRKCNCTCPECGEPLEAKNKGKTENAILEPNQKQAHFAHVSGKVCQYAAESALHKMAKEILFEHRTLMVPALYHYNEKVSDEARISFDNVEVEFRVTHDGSTFIPDAILTKGNRKLFIEFYKTHRVDENKKHKIGLLGISTIEVDLNFIEPIINGKPNYEGLKEFIETDATFSEWLYNSEGERLYKKKSLEGPIKPLYSLDYLKKQDELNDKELHFHSLKRTPEEQAKVNSSVEKWKDKNLAKGYQLIKIYGFYEEFVYCPKKSKPENKIDALNCRMCEYFLENYYQGEEKFSLCGYRAKIIKTDFTT